MAGQNRRRLVLLGAGGVGKTALVAQYTGKPLPADHTPTIQDFHEHHAEFPGNKSLMIEILDTAGVYQFPAMREVSIQWGNAFLVVYSVDSKESFCEAKLILEHIQTVKGSPPIILVGNKADVEDKFREVCWTEAEAFCLEKSVRFVETTATCRSEACRVFRTALCENGSKHTTGNDNQRARKDSLVNRLVKNVQYLIGKEQVSAKETSETNAEQDAYLSLHKKTGRRGSSPKIFAYLRRRRSSGNNNSSNDNSAMFRILSNSHENTQCISESSYED